MPVQGHTGVPGASSRGTYWGAGADVTVPRAVGRRAGAEQQRVLALRQPGAQGEGVVLLRLASYRITSHRIALPQAAFPSPPLAPSPLPLQT